MIPLKTLYTTLESAGFPVAYRKWDQAPQMPYICYFEAYSDNFAADGVTYYPISHIQIELYTEQKDPEAEAKVEQTLTSFFWEKTEEYIDTERCYQTIYEIEV